MYTGGVKQFGHRAGRGGDVTRGLPALKDRHDEGGLLRPSLFVWAGPLFGLARELFGLAREKIFP